MVECSRESSSAGGEGQDSFWRHFPDWLRGWFGKQQTDNRWRHEIEFYEPATSRLLARLPGKAFNTPRRPRLRGVRRITSAPGKDETLIEIWDWPLSRPWLSILGWPAVLVGGPVAWRWRRSALPRG